MVINKASNKIQQTYMRIKIFTYTCVGQISLGCPKVKLDNACFYYRRENIYMAVYVLLKVLFSEGFQKKEKKKKLPSS